MTYKNIDNLLPIIWAALNRFLQYKRKLRTVSMQQKIRNRSEPFFLFKIQNNAERCYYVDICYIDLTSFIQISYNFLQKCSRHKRDLILYHVFPRGILAPLTNIIMCKYTF